MNTLALLTSCCLLVVAGEGAETVRGRAPRRLVTKNLVLSNGMDWGEWGSVEYCPDGTFAVDLELKFEDYEVIDLDETAVNAIKLYCATADFIHTGYIMSSEGRHGEWKGMRTCTTGFMTAMRAQVLQDQNLGDDVAVQNLEMECNFGPETIVGVDQTSTKIKDGEWGIFSRCPEGSAICGIEVRIEDEAIEVDLTEINDISMFCCALD